MAGTADDEPRAADLHAVKKKTLSRALECTTRHIDHLEERGRIPRDAVLGEGAGKRYLIAAVFAALGRVAPAAIVDPIVEEGRAYARSRSVTGFVDLGEVGALGSAVGLVCTLVVSPAGFRLSDDALAAGPVLISCWRVSNEQLKAGDIIAGRFCIERVLGMGGMGTVFAAHDRELARRVAIKVMVEETARDPLGAERFQREARLAVQLQSAHAARVFDFGRSRSGQPFIVMEYLDGEDLDAHVRTAGPLPPSIAVDYLLQACDALGEAHRLGMVHRDIKLKNMFLTKTADGRPLVKVLDFGIAKTIGVGSEDISLTTASSVLGSPAYMAPEQMRGASGADERSDIWSLGVCTYELLTAHMPFEAGTIAEVCSLVLTTRAPPVTKWIAGVAPELETIVETCLEKDPAKRFQSVAELAAALSAAAAASAVSEGACEAATPPAIPRPANEAARLAALRRYRLLDTPPEEDFTFLAEIAAAVCGSPCAFVTLVDEHRVWYKAWHGIEAESLEAARDDDYCSWAILEDTLLQIPDLTRDPRGATISSTVGEPKLRMYCGANLLTPDGLRIGTLCVVDTVARSLSESQQRLLTKLARQVMALIELRAKKAELHAALGEMKRLATSVL